MRKTVERVCCVCGGVFMTYPRGTKTARYCSRRCSSADYRNNLSEEGKAHIISAHVRKPIIRVCAWCQCEYTLPSNKGPQSTQRFCTMSCAAKWRNSQPERKEFLRALAVRVGRANRGRKRPDSSLRMKTDNPMQSEAVRNKVAEAAKGRTFLARGGNSKTTPAQEAVAKALGWEMEMPINTVTVATQFVSLPHCYKVDIGNSDVRLAIEIDGASHRTRLWKYLDRRKTEVLEALGWTVIRFTNEQVQTDIAGVLDAISEVLARLTAKYA